MKKLLIALSILFFLSGCTTKPKEIEIEFNETSLLRDFVAIEDVFYTLHSNLEGNYEVRQYNQDGDILYTYILDVSSWDAMGMNMCQVNSNIVLTYGEVYDNKMNIVILSDILEE